jgi:UDP-glucose 4-epimerase
VNPVPRRLADTSRAMRDLRFKAESKLEDGLRKLSAWRRDILSREGAAGLAVGATK